MLTPEIVDRIFSVFSENNPTPESELHYKNEYTLLVAVVLSAQATDKSVNIATDALFKSVLSPEQMILLGEEALSRSIKNIGLYSRKARYIIALSKELVAKYNGRVPQTREQLESLPGVGRKTANVVLNIAFKKDTIAVDTHVFRVARRIGLSNGHTPLETEYQLLNIIPQKWIYNAHHWLILHGRYCCIARNPKCIQCVVKEYCHSYNNNNF